MRAVPASLRLANQRSIIEQLLISGTATRAQLAKATGISQPTAGKIIDDLLEAGVVEEIPNNGDPGRAATLGRPGRTIRLARQAPRFVAIHLGVRTTYVAALPAAMPVRGDWDTQFPTPNDAGDWEERLGAALGKLELNDIWGIVLSVPGIVDERQGQVMMCPNLHWTERANVPELLARIWPTPTSLLNEVRALALGQLSVEPDAGDFLMVDLGDGVGGAVVLGGRLYQGPLPHTGEIGHTPVVGAERPCGCGSRGCLETLVAEPGLLQSFREHGGPEDATLDTLRESFAEGPLPPWLVEALDATAAAVAGSLNVLGLRRATLAGAVTQLGGKAMEYLCQAVESRAMWARFDSVQCTVVPQHRLAGLVLAGIQNLVIPTDWSRRAQAH